MCCGICGRAARDTARSAAPLSGTSQHCPRLLGRPSVHSPPAAAAAAHDRWLLLPCQCLPNYFCYSRHGGEENFFIFICSQLGKVPITLHYAENIEIGETSVRQTTGVYIWRVLVLKLPRVIFKPTLDNTHPCRTICPQRMKSLSVVCVMGMMEMLSMSNAGRRSVRGEGWEDCSGTRAVLSHQPHAD